MQTLNYWKQFEHTGKVEDYLSYVSNETFVAERTSGVMQTSDSTHKSDVQVQEKAGANPYAGIHMCNRNDIETDAYRGI